MVQTLRKFHPLRWAFLVCSLLLTFSPIAPLAQQVLADAAPVTLSGQVTGGEPATALPGAVIDVLAPGSATIIGSSTSGADGAYAIADIAPTTYDVRITAPAGSGLQNTTLPNIELLQSRVINISLTPAGPTPVTYEYTYHGKLLMGGQPFSTSSALGLRLQLSNASRAFSTTVGADRNGDYSFVYSSATETTAPTLSLKASFYCGTSFCSSPEADAGKIPQNYTVTSQPITFTTDTVPVINLPYQRLSFRVFDPSGNELLPFATLSTRTASGDYEVAPGIGAHWTGGGDSSFFQNVFKGYVIPGATYTFMVSGTGYNAVPVTVTANGDGDIVQNVTVTDPIPTSYSYTYHGKLQFGGQGLGTTPLGLQLTLKRPNGMFIANPSVSSSGDYSFTYTSATETTAPDLQLVPQLSCRSSCQAMGTYASAIPSNFSVTSDANSPLTFTTSNQPAINIPLTHLTLSAVDTAGNPLDSWAYLNTKTASGDFELAPGVNAHWTGGDSTGFFQSGPRFNGYLLPGPTYNFTVNPDNYEPVPLTLTAVPGEMQQSVTATTPLRSHIPIPITANSLWADSLCLGRWLART